MKRKILLAAVAALGLGMMASASMADTTVVLDATFNVGNSNTVDINSTVGPTNAGTHGDYEAGIYNFTVNSVNTTNGIVNSPSNIFSVGDPLHGVCIDFTHDINNGQTSYWAVASLTDVTSAMNGSGLNTNPATNAIAIAHLFDKQGVGGYNLNAGELQVAVWQVLYGGTNGANDVFSSDGSGSGLTSGPSGQIGVAEAAAAGAVNWAGSNSSTTPDVIALINTDSTGATVGSLQDFAFVSPGNDLTNVSGAPLPSSLIGGSFYSLDWEVAGFCGNAAAGLRLRLA